MSRTLRIALPKGRNLPPTLEAFGKAGLDFSGYDKSLLRQTLPGASNDGLDGLDVELVQIKDWDLPLYVEQGIAHCGIVGTDVLEEQNEDLLAPLSLKAGRSRFSIIGTASRLPAAGSQIRVATKYPRWSQRLLRGRPWGIEIFKLSGSVELGPLLELSEVACDIVQTGSTIKAHQMVELEVLAEIAPTLVIGRSAFHQYRGALLGLMHRLEAAGVVA